MRILSMTWNELFWYYEGFVIGAFTVGTVWYCRRFKNQKKEPLASKGDEGQYWTL